MDQRRQVLLRSFALLFATIAAAAWLLKSIADWLVTLDSPIAGAIVAAAASILGLAYTQWNSKTREIAEGHRPQKIKLFENFLDLTDRFMDGVDLPDDGELPEDLKKQFREINRGLIIWASPAVIKSWIEFRKNTGEGKVDVLLYADDVMQAMRKDLGNSNFTLKRGDVIKPYLKNPSEIDDIRDRFPKN